MLFNGINASYGCPAGNRPDHVALTIGSVLYESFEEYRNLM
jgi:hypothetical protein